MFLLLLTACVTSGGKRSEETNNAFSRDEDHSQSDLSETGIVNSENQVTAEGEKTPYLQKDFSNLDKGKAVQNTDPPSSNSTLSVNSNECQPDINGEESGDDNATGVESFDEGLDTEWGN